MGQEEDSLKKMLIWRSWIFKMKSETITDWENVHKNPTKSYKEFFEKEKEFLKNKILKDSVVLDIGCGTGELIKILSLLVKKIIGIDNDEEAIKRCNKNLKDINNAEIFLEDGEKMHFKDNTFDFVICMGTTFGNFSETKFIVLKEIKRVLNKNGSFIFSIYNELALNERLTIYKNYWKGFFEKDNGVVIYKNVISEQFSEEDIKKILGKANFEIEELVKGKIFYIIKAKIKN
mgnify:FL=1